MKTLACLVCILFGIGFILWGRFNLIRLKKNKYTDPTLGDYRLIFIGILGIIFGILGLFNIIPWEK